MGRPLTGSVRPKGDGFEASVPKRLGSKDRHYAQFDLEEDARAWCAQAVVQLQQGKPPTRPGRTPAAPRVKPAGPGTVRNGPDFEQMAREWVELVYDQNHQAQAGRAQQVRDQIRLHLAPYFSGPMPLRGELRPEDAGEVAVIDWVRAQAGYEPRHAGAPITARPKGRARSTTKGILNTLKEIIAYASSQGFDVQDTVGPVRAMEPRNGKRKRRARLADYATCREIAAELHAVHQLVFWLMRVLGLRVSESYGIRLGVISDLGTIGLLQVRAQGGRIFMVRNDDEEIERLKHVETVKTDAGYRLVVIPPALMKLVRIVIAAYHTDADGFVDPQARLIPNLNSAEGGQGGFQTAFRKVARQLGVDDDEDSYTAHDLRKSLCSDLGWNTEVSELVQRRFVGHKAGSDVFAATYLLDRREIADLSPVVDAIEADIVASIGTLVIRTERRALHGREVYRDRRHTIEAVLVGDLGKSAPLSQAGEHVGGRDDHAGYLDVGRGAQQVDRVQVHRALL